MVCPNCNTESGPSLFCYVCDAYLPSMSEGVKASIPSRLGAFLLDVVFLVTVLLVVGAIAYNAGVHVAASAEGYDPKTFFIVFFGGVLGFFVILLWFLARGQTPGKLLMDIRAADKRNGSNPRLGRMLLRETFGKWVSGCFFGLGWFWAIWDRDGQAWHDKIVRTVVLHRPTQTTKRPAQDLITGRVVDVVLYRRSQTSKYLFLLLLFGTPLLCAGFLWAILVTRTAPPRIAREAAVSAVPFVGCASDGQQGPVPAPKGTEMVVRIGAGAAARLAYYKAAGLDVLAPRGWYCFEAYGSDGSSLFVAPQPMGTAWGGYTGATAVVPVAGGFTGPAIQISEISGETSGRYGVARVLARIFPGQRAFVESVIEEGADAADFPFGPYPNDKLILQSDRMVQYQTPPHSQGLGTDSSLQADEYPINGVAILEGQAPDVLILNVRLPPDMNDLASHIISSSISEQMGRENAETSSEK